MPSGGFDRCDVKNAINIGLRKGVRKGLGMKKYDSINDRFNGAFQEVEERIRAMKHNYFKKPFYSVNRLVRGMFIVTVDKKLQLGMCK